MNEVIQGQLIKKAIICSENIYIRRKEIIIQDRTLV